jgi:hypothetical protein
MKFFLVPHLTHDISENSVLNLPDTATSIVQQAAWKGLVLTKSCLNSSFLTFKRDKLCRATEAASHYVNRVINYQN